MRTKVLMSASESWLESASLGPIRKHNVLFPMIVGKAHHVSKWAISRLINASVTITDSERPRVKLTYRRMPIPEKIAFVGENI